MAEGGEAGPPGGVRFELPDLTAEGDEGKTEPSEEGGGHKPTCVIVLGMAGSGKTTFVQRLTSELHRQVPVEIQVGSRSAVSI